MSDLLPPSARPQARALSLAIARAGEVTTPVRTLHDADTCPAALLPWLAWAESVDEWDTAWTEARKRSAMKASRAIHERKGTVGAMRRAVDALGYDIDITEWFQRTPPADPYTFGALIVVDQEPLANEAAFAQIINVANAAKNLRSHMTGVDIKALTACTYFAAACLSVGEVITIAAEAP